MPTTITWTENYDSRKYVRSNTNSSMQLLYTVKGTASAKEVADYVEANAPDSEEDLIRGNIQVDPVHVDTDNLDKCLWKATVNYVPETSPQAAAGTPASFSFDMGGGTRHIVASLETVGAYPAGTATVGDNGKLIGVSDNGVEGVDIEVPVYTFSETHYLDDSVVTDAYKGKLYALTGKTNHDAFKGCQPYECLFLGASGSKRGGERWEITFKFAASPNDANLTVGDITGIVKKGWDYLWVRYKPVKLAGLKAIGQVPAAVYVEQVRKDGNFADLGIGV